MNKNIRRILAFILCFTFVFSFFDTKAYSSTYSTVTKNTYAVVTKVFDGETFEARDINNNYYLVKMIGVDSKGYTDAYEYTYNRLMGKEVLLTLDTYVTSPVGRWNNCYVRQGGEVINTKLIALGYGSATVDNSNTYVYNEYQKIETDAKDDSLGMWDYVDYGEDTTSKAVYNEDVININTASSSQLRSSLKGVDSSLASAIVSYRKYNPFNVITDIKFVEGMTKEIYDDNKDILHVVTNVDEAYEKELNSLKGISEEEADAIVDYRDKHNNITIEDLLDEGLITSDEYNDNKYFITDDDDDRIYHSVNSFGANINTASQSQITKTGISDSDAKGIIKIRDEGYSFKTVGELQKSTNVNFTNSELRKLLDNIKVKTDINYSSQYELQSLFGISYGNYTDNVEDIIDGRYYNSIDKVSNYIPNAKYQDIKDFIYVKEATNEYVNINTATKAQLEEIGISGSTATKISEHSRIMRDYLELPNGVDLTSYDDSISLFTNINNTSKLELKSLSPDITDSFASEILDYADDQPFGSMEEVLEFFEENNMKDVYYDIEDYIVLF